MAIEDRNLGPGTKLVGRYHKTEHKAEVVQLTDGTIVYRLEDGREFKSISSAASALMGGVAVNGWRFWSLEGELKPLPEAKPKAEKAPKEPKAPRSKTTTTKPGRRGKLIKKVANQTGVLPEQVKWFCSGCMASFLADKGVTPTSCPAGHVEGPDELAAPDELAEAIGDAEVVEGMVPTEAPAEPEEIVVDAPAEPEAAPVA